MAKKCILVLLDGVGDRSYSHLGHRTPLQAAQTPFLDRLARDGANGLYHAALLGQALPSENAHFAMFGYDMEAFPGRGALEALGAGIPVDSGEVAILAHFVTVRRSSENTLILIDGKPEAAEKEIRSLIEEVGHFSAADIQVRLHHTHGFRGILTLNGQVTPFVTDSDPIIQNRPLTAISPWKTFDDDPPTRDTAWVLGAYLQWAYRRLHKHPLNRQRQKSGQPPINGLVTQRAGRLKNIAPLAQRYGLRGLCIASGIVYHGLATYLGMDVRKVADSPIQETIWPDACK